MLYTTVHTLHAFYWFFDCFFDAHGRDENLLRLWEELRRKRNGNVKSDAAIALPYVCASKAFSALTLNLHIFLLFFIRPQKKRGERGYFLPLFM